VLSLESFVAGHQEETSDSGFGDQDDQVRNDSLDKRKTIEIFCLKSFRRVNQFSASHIPTILP